MAHKVKKPKPTPEQRQQQKTQHYQQQDQLMQQLKDQRIKEKQLNQDITERKLILAEIRHILEFTNKYPEAVPFRAFKGGWALSYGVKHRQAAIDQLIQDQNKFEKETSVLTTQLNLCLENQVQIENQLRKIPVFNPHE